MTIADPHALPEDEATATAYVTEADQSWDAGDPDRAYDLYHSVRESGVSTAAQRSHASFRLAYIALNRGDHDAAWDFCSTSEEPGTAELRRSLDNATPNDPAPDPDVIPETPEQSEDWWNKGIEARKAGDYALSQRFFVSIASSTCNDPTVIAKASVLVGEALHKQGDDPTARQWLEAALPNLDSSEQLELARDLLGEIGVHSTADHSSPAAEQVVDGVAAYENGDLADARSRLQAALNLEGPAEVKGRAAFYLGSMDYQERKYADARHYLKQASDSAPVQERDWADQMLAWRWDE